MVLTALVLLILVGMAALAIDLGRVHMAKQRLHDVLDAAVIAAVWALEPGEIASGLVAATDAADAIIKANNKEHGLQVDRSDIQIAADGRGVTIGGKVTVEFGFARVIGFKSPHIVKASARAVLEHITDFPYQFAPTAVTDWQIQATEPGMLEHLRTPYWETENKPGLANDPNLYPVTFGGDTYDPETYQMQLAGTYPAFHVVTESDITSISSNVVQSTYESLDLRTRTDQRKWDWWQTATEVQRATSKRIVIMPVMDADTRSKVVGFTGFFITDVFKDVYTSPTGIPLEYTNLKGYFVPGIVGPKSVRWMKPFLPSWDQQNFMYRVRLTQ